MQDQVAYHALFNLRFVDETDRILARHGDDVDTHFPDPADLEELGADLVVLHAAINGGMAPAVLGRAINDGVDISLLSQALALGLEPDAVADLLDSYAADDLNGHLAKYVEAGQEAALYPDPVDRVLARLDS